MIARVKQVLKVALGVLFYPLLASIPRSSSKMIFGAWGGGQFSDNPKYFLRAILKECPSMRCYWIGYDYLKPLIENEPGVIFIRMGSLRSYWHLFTAKYYVCNVDWRWDLGEVPIYGRVIIINLWHGIPYKRIGCRQQGGKQTQYKKIGWMVGFFQVLRKKYLCLRQWVYSDQSWTSVSSEKMRLIMCESFPNRFSDSRMVVAGLSRNDFLIQNHTNLALRSMLKAKYAKLIGLPIDKKWYLYLPTWRKIKTQLGTNEDSQFSFAISKYRDKYQEILSMQDAVLIEKQHHVVLIRTKLINKSNESIKVINSGQATQIDLQELLLVSDRLITDYSSCFFDFALLNRPCIHFAYDFAKYTGERPGVEYDLNEIAIGPIVKTEDELIQELRLSDKQLLSKRTPKWQEPIQNELGYSSLELIRAMKIGNRCLWK